MFQPVSWSPANDPDIRVSSNTGRTLAIEAVKDLTINGIDDVTRGTTDGDLVIRTYDSTGMTFERSIQYPTISVDSASTLEIKAPLTFHVDHLPYNSTTELFYGGYGCRDTGTGTITFNTSDLYYQPFRRTRTRGRSVVRRNHHGLQPRAVNVDFSTATPEEITALQLLRGLVGQEEFRRYLKYGFVMVRGASGLRYQITRGRHVINVWNERGRVDGICVYLQGRFPPTDDTITRMLMAERDELELWRRGNSNVGRSATLADLQRLYSGSSYVKVAA